MNGYDLHTHTNASFDSDLSLDDYTAATIAAGLKGVAVTDHDTIEGALQLRDRCPPFQVIVGCEFTLANGTHLIGLYLDGKPITGTTLSETALTIRTQGGLVLLPHPYRTGTGILGEAPDDDTHRAIMPHIDLIEVFNAKSALEENLRAVELARCYGKPASAGSDAHRAAQIGNGRVRVSGPQRHLGPRRLLREPIRVTGIDMTDTNENQKQNRREGIRRLMVKFQQTIPNDIWRWGKKQWEHHCDRRDMTRPRPYREYGRFSVSASHCNQAKRPDLAKTGKQKCLVAMHDVAARGNEGTQ